MYHDVTPGAEASGGGKVYFSVSASRFERQLDLIRDAGMRGCSIADAIANPGTPRVAISFDDGDLGQAVRGFPALAARGMTATFFVTTSWIGKPSYASWAQLREMRAAGMAIESHTHSHPFLSELDASALRDELTRSRDLIDEHLDQHTTQLAFPGGDAPKRELRAMLSEAGYAVIGTSRWGVNTDGESGSPRYIARCTVRGETDDAAFMAIASANRWLATKKRARETVLRVARTAIGPSRYAKLRRGFLNAIRSSDTPNR
jgi:peptidoglycan/xylan/chitin deacetylase (PgdA/CDA1 family)